jgi:2-hydroxy-3-keto-5-methylthiopentenyl-1-phosphate phosphatase
MGGPWTLCCDFDGTMVEQIVVQVMDEAFGGPDASELDDAYRDRRIGVQEYTARRFAPFRVDSAQVVALARERVRLRPGIGEVVRLCRERDVGLRVLSGGLDTYVLPLLEPLGVRAAEVTAARARFEPGGIVAEAPPDVGGLEFKAAAVASEIASDRRVLYVGDGSNDREAAERATFVLARRSLLEHCLAAGLPCAPFGDFRDVATWLEESTRKD